MSLDKLTSKEKEVAKLVADGLTNKEIGIELNISWFTVKTHTQNIYRKLRVHNRINLMKAINVT